MRATRGRQERTVGRLQAAYVDGALSTDTFEARVARAYESRSATELSDLLVDVPTLFNRLRRRVEQLADELLAPATPAREVALPIEEDASILVGRSSSCDVVLEHDSVSRRHVEITRDRAGWTVRDLGSTNGTIAGRRRIATTRVRAGDTLWLGCERIRLT